MRASSATASPVRWTIACYADENPFDATPERLVISDLYVAPEARGIGTARALPEAALAQARRNGAARVTVTPIATNKDAAGTYAALGFTPAEVTYEVELRA